MTARTLVLRNRSALAGWIFMALWMGMLGLFTWLLARDGQLPGVEPLMGMGIFAVFWLFGVAGCAYVLAQPCITVTLTGEDVSIRERFLWRSQTETFPIAQLGHPSLITGKDSEGDRYFRCELITPGGRAIVCAESHSEERVAAVRDRVMAFIA